MSKIKQNISAEDRELYQRTDEVLHYLWDPIHVSGVPQARDEYHSYLPQSFSLVKRCAKSIEIANHLTAIEHDQMGLSTNEQTKKRNVEIGDILLDYKDWIKEKAEQSVPGYPPQGVGSPEP